MVNRYGITLGYEKDRCSICAFIKEVRFLYDKEKLIVAAVCDICASSSGLVVESVLEKYGKKTTRKNIDVLSREEFYKKGLKMEHKKENNAK